MEVYHGYDTDGERMIEVPESYLEKLRRALYLLNPVKELLQAQADSPIVIDVCSDILMHYDDAECDGYCLLEDIKDVLEMDMKEVF